MQCILMYVLFFILKGVQSIYKGKFEVETWEAQNYLYRILRCLEKLSWKPSNSLTLWICVFVE